MFCAAATSAAMASQLSHDQPAMSVGPSARRATSSAVAANRRAAAAASTRAHSAIAATTAASSTCFSDSALGNDNSNILSILTSRLRHRSGRNHGLWTNS